MNLTGLNANQRSYLLTYLEASSIHRRHGAPPELAARMAAETAEREHPLTANERAELWLAAVEHNESAGAGQR